jgi:DNA repair ATPase RecN
VSEIRRLDERERLEELSRMLGGIEVSDAHRAAAAAMLATRASPGERADGVQGSALEE